MNPNRNINAPESNVHLLFGLNLKPLEDGVLISNVMKRETISCIYIITNPNGRSYIGQTKDYYRRISHYRWQVCKQQTLLYFSMQKYGFNSHEIKILETCKHEDLNEREIYYIAKLKTLAPNGMNLKAGGSQGGVCSEETKRKIGDKHRGKKASPETLEKYRKRMTGSGNPMHGKHHSKETIEKISNRLSGHPSLKKKRSDETKKRMSFAFRKQRGKTVYQIDLKGNIISTFTCIASAVEITKIPRHSIKCCCNGRQKTGNGFYWSYDKNFKIPELKKINCLNCNKEFIKNNGNKMFCSKFCVKDYNKEKTKLKAKEYVLKNKEKLKQYHLNYKIINEDILKEKRRERYLNNKEYILAKVKENYKKRKELKSKSI